MGKEKLLIFLALAAVGLFLVFNWTVPGDVSDTLAAPADIPAVTDQRSSGQAQSASAVVDIPQPSISRLPAPDQLAALETQAHRREVGSANIMAAEAPAAATWEALTADGHRPLMIRWSNWRPEFGTALVYARAQDLNGMLNMDAAAPVVKMLMITSYGEAEQMMTQADLFHAAGISIIGLNTENGVGMTPPDEMASLNNPDPERNVVARVARLATENGFTVIWGPYRAFTDTVSDSVIRTIMASGIRGLALQEQKFIEVMPAAARLDSVNRTRDRYLRIANELGIDDFSFHVQIMQQRCPDLENCVEFVRMMESIPVETIAIWSNGPIPNEFVRAIRGY